MNTGETEASTQWDDGLLNRTYELGLKWMQCREYNKALSLFSKAMKVSRSYPLEMIEEIRANAGLPRRCVHDKSKAYHPLYTRLLDSRISCLMKVRNYTKAVKESQYYCRIDPSSTRAVLRLGKSYELAERTENAIQAYSKGMDLVERLKKRGNSVSPVHQKLFKHRVEDLLRNKATEESEDTKKNVLLDQKTAHDIDELDSSDVEITMVKKAKTVSKDPIDMLPTELLISTMCYLDAKDIITCMTVCKAWYLKICATPMIISCINLNRTTYSKICSLIEFSKSKPCVSPRIDQLNYSVKLPRDESKCSQMLFRNLRKPIEKMVLHFSHVDTLQVMRLLVQNPSSIEKLKQFSLLGPFGPFSYPTYDLSFLEGAKSLEKIEVLATANNTRDSYHSVSMSKVLELLSGTDLKHLQSSLRSIKLIYKDTTSSGETPFGLFFYQVPVVFTNVSKLVLSGRDFGLNHDWSWLSHFPNLTDLWLERNKGLHLMDFMKYLQLPQVFKRLKSLTFRETSSDQNRNHNGDVWSDGQMEVVMSNLQHVQNLDVMNSAIMRSMLYRLLNELSEIKRLNIGNVIEMADELYPQSDVETSAFLFLRHMTHLTELSVPNMASHHIRTFRQLTLALPDLTSLQKLDLSFNPSMQGYQLYDMLRECASNEVRPKVLIIDGCQHIAPATVKDIENNDFVSTVECSFNKQMWEKFGVNSFWYR